jgi:ABC-type transport system involved in multi-copper enzyme maturation permease subunit
MSVKSIRKYFIGVKPKGYGRSIPIIATELIKSTIKEKRFYLALLYFAAFPLLILLVSNVQPAIQSGTGIALFEAQSAVRNYILAIYLSFFLGQVFIVLLNADAISGEIEEQTLPLLRSKPVYDSEIIFGKFLGMVAIISLLDLPVLLIIYYSNMIKFDADFPMAYIATIDEIFGAIIFLILIQSVIIALTLVFSTMFSRSLYSILSSLLGLFMISQISDLLSDSNNYISFNWLIRATLPKMLYHLEPLESSTPSLASILSGVILVISGLLSTAILILRRKELT